MSLRTRTPEKTLSLLFSDSFVPLHTLSHHITRFLLHNLHELTREVMSLISDNMDKNGVSSTAAAVLSAGVAAPRLVAGSSYSSWRPNMDVFLQRSGAEGIHTQATTKEEWLTTSQLVVSWGDEAYAAALALASGVAVNNNTSGQHNSNNNSNSDNAHASSSASTVLASAAAAAAADVKVSPSLSEEIKAARKLVSARVERSRRVYGIIYGALPDELRLQVADLPTGWAFGLWQWLQNKYQSTEEDNVNALVGQWMQLKQDDTESFDAYKARVNKLYALLEHAKEKPSARQYSFTLLDKLLPRYAAAVLALKASGQLKDAASISWDTVTAFVNSHERSEQRLGAEDKAMAARGADGSSSSSFTSKPKESQRGGGAGTGAGGNARVRTLADVQCFNCEAYGHLSRNCPRPQKGQGAATGGPTAGQGASTQSAGFPRRRENTRPAKGGARSAVTADVQSDDDVELEVAFHVSYAAVVKGGLSGATVKPKPASPLASTAIGSVALKQPVPVAPTRAAAPAVPAPKSESSHELAIVSRRRKPSTQAEQAKSALPGARVKTVTAVAAAAKTAQPVPTPPTACVAKEAQCYAASIGAVVPSQPPAAGAAWGIDSMASLHISGNKQLFRTGLHSCAPVRVEVADGGVVTSTLQGSVELQLRSTDGKSGRIVVDNVHYHERFTANLLSWNVLRTKKWELHSTAEETYVITPGRNKVTLNTRGRVSVLDSFGTARSTGSDRVFSVGELVCDDADSLVRLHERLGHVGFDRMIAQIKGGATLDLAKLNVSDAQLKEARRRVMQCKACTHGKGSRTAFGHRGLDHGTTPGEVLHMDTFQVRVDRDGRSCLEYGLTVGDPFANGRWFVRLSTKDEAAGRVIRIVTNVQTQYNTKVKRLYADGGTEFINHTLRDFCAKNGIELHYPPARTQQLNGIAERNVRSTKDAVRTLLLHSGLPIRFWSHAARHSNYVWNRTHVAKATGVTPYETLYKKKPSARHWSVFGCDAFYHLPKVQRDVFERKMEPCIYLGHDETQNCAIVLDCKDGKEVRTRDVEYREQSFTHATALRLAETEPVAAAAAPAQPSDPVADGGEYEVERIMGKRMRNGRTEYHVKWANYDERDATWEPADNIDGAQEALADFNARAAASPPAPDGVLEHAAEQHVAAPDVAPSAPASPVADVDCHSAQDASAQSSACVPIPAAVPAAATAPRRSPRFTAPRSDDDGEVHMAMCAIAGMQSSPFSVAGDEVVCAVSSGIALLEQQTPKTYREAMSSPSAPGWRASMDKEIASCAKKGVWTLVARKDLPRGTNVLPNKWVYRIKIDEVGTLTELKSRVTPKGFKQKEGVDYFEVFAATGRYKSLRLGLSLTARWDHELVQMDVPTAFLNAEVEEEVYMELPEGYRDGHEGMVCKLNKSLYGLKQSPRNWYLLFSGFIMKQMGFKATVSDPCLFFKRSRTGRLILLFLFVDDTQTSYHRDDQSEWNELKAMLVKRFDTKDLGESKWILGMRISRDRKARTIMLDQELYVTKALEKYGLAECKPVITPEVTGHRDTDESASRLSDQLLQQTDQQRYMEITGTLMYASISTRPDISHAVHRLASHMQAPTRQHMADAERCLRYLAGTKDVGLIFGSRSGAPGEGGLAADSRGRALLQVDVCAYADADWANDKADRKSITGWVAKVNGDPISWASKKQRTVAQSTCEAELYAEAAAIQEVLWLRGILTELSLHLRMGSAVYGDNQSTIAVSKNGIKGERTKHVDVKYHFITETVENGVVQLKWIPTTEQQADIFTKALGAPVFELLRRALMTR